MNFGEIAVTDWHVDDDYATRMAELIESGQIDILDAINRSISIRNISCLGVAYAFLIDTGENFDTKLNVDWDVCIFFIKKYFQLCIEVNPDSQFADSRYSACWDAARWISGEISAPRPSFLLGVDWVRPVFENGDESVRLAIETGMLEHLPKTIGIGKLFIDWLDSGALQDALSRSGLEELAILAARSGGRGME
ncbi:MAG: hypothetical protein KA505_03860 [Xanthomonadales bacterium]|nr:hypothetical protein [Xanthomonadales bacterium]MBP6077924.1 hypothetical protein [Xanthomonadales bacterium]